MLTDIVVHSPYMSNIPNELLAAQKKVFDAMEIGIVQTNIDGMSHGKWMTTTARSSKSKVTVFCDIDAFPLKRSSFHNAVTSAAAGKLFGLAQTANHLRPNDLYVGPMFMAFSRLMYKNIGQPTLEHSQRFDPGQNLTDCARSNDVEIQMVFPTFAILPKWPLANTGIFGIGTFYGDLDFFHLFQCRRKRNIELFVAVANDVALGRPLNFRNYINIAQSGWQIPYRLRSSYRIPPGLRRVKEMLGIS